MESMNRLCLLVLFLAIVSTSGSTGLHLGVSFVQLNELVYDKMNLECSGDGTVHGPRMTLMMKMGKVGDPKPQAIFNLGTGRTMTPMNASKTITAVGHVDKVSSQIFLTVTIDRPDEKDAGTYKCQLLYMDQQHHIQEEKELLKVVIEAPDTSAVIKYLIKQLEDLKETDRFQKEMIGELKAKNGKLTDYVTNVIATQNKTAATHSKKIADLNTRADYLRDSMAIVNHTVKANTKSTQSHDRVLAELNVADQTMKDQFQDFKKIATYLYAFMANYREGDTFSKSQTLRFRDVALNKGGFYSASSGVFTAPVDGLYVFHFNLRSAKTETWMIIYLRVNQNSLVKVCPTYSDGRSQGSTQAVVHLRPGDKVDPWVYSYKRNFKVDGRGFTTFSGFLVQAY